MKLKVASPLRNAAYGSLRFVRHVRPAKGGAINAKLPRSDIRHVLQAVAKVDLGGSIRANSN
jgi:hypothetical protein